MRDQNLYWLVCSTLLVFAAIALYAERAVLHLTRRTNTRPPPHALLAVTRIWFGLLALGCLGLLLAPLFGRHSPSIPGH